MKPGYKTTEFWTALLTAAGTIFGSLPWWGAIAPIAYIIIRGLDKSSASKAGKDV